MRRSLFVLACVAAWLAAPAPSSAKTPASATAEPPPSWASLEIDNVVAAGLFPPDAFLFHPDDPVTRGELYEALAHLGKPAAVPGNPSRIVTIRELDAALVRAVGLLPAARRLRLAAQDAGLAPHAALGTETIARLLGFRFDHPLEEDDLERGWRQPASRAEAAYSFSRLLTLDPASVERLEGLVQSFALPALSSLQRDILGRALRLVGTPYVWAGVSELSQLRWAVDGLSQVPVAGGFDCSGFVWRVYKLYPFAEAPALAGVLKGRSSYDMSGEVPLSLRVPLEELQPGDLVFFGTNASESDPSEVGHMGIYVGAGWFVHSSRVGVTLQPLQDWYRETFAWGRRPLAEAGLTA
jgi:cell wall-associated NlpC family hydrolase